VKAKSELVEGALLLQVAFLLVNAPYCHLSLVLASVVQGDAVNCNSCQMQNRKMSKFPSQKVGLNLKTNGANFECIQLKR